MSHRRRGAESGPEPTLPITPMLDMTFQLLFFFMGTFNPTDPEVAQVLAMSQEKKVEEKDKKTDAMAQDPKKVKDDVIPDNKKEEKKKEEELEIDTDLRLFVELGGSREQPHVHYLLSKGAVKLDEGVIPPYDPKGKKESWFSLGDTKSRERIKALGDLNKKMLSELEAKKQEAKETARKEGQPEGAPDHEKTVAAALAKQKLRIQTSIEAPWGLVFETMNYCTNLGFKTVALTTPKDYVPKAQQQKD